MSEYAGVYDFLKEGIPAFFKPQNETPENVKKLVSGKDYQVQPSSSFVQFDSPHYDSERAEKNGWKFHMSVSQEQTGRALEIMLEEHKKSGHTGAFKVAIGQTATKFSDPTYHQAGKMFTIYDDGADPNLTKRLMQKLEERFQAEGIKPGPSVNGDRAVPGSSYSSYRNDRTLDGRYVDDKSDYNISKRPDPFADFQVQKPLTGGMPSSKLSSLNDVPALQNANITDTDKGKYLGVKEPPERIAEYKQSLIKAGYVEGRDFSVGPSSTNGGNDVVKMTYAAGAKLSAEQAAFHAKPSPQVATPANSPAAKISSLNETPLLQKAEITNTNKGMYLGIGEGPEKIEQYKASLAKAGYVEGKDFTVSPSSANGGNNVVKMTPIAGAKLAAEQEAFRAQPSTHLAEASQRAREQLAQIPAEPKPVVVQPPSAQQPQSQPPQQPPKSSPPKTDVDAPEGTHGSGIRTSATANASAKINAGVGKAAIAAEAAVHLAQGDVAGAATSVAKDIATQSAIKTGVGFVAKRIPIVGGVVTAGMALFSAGAQAAQGNWKMAGVELLAGGAEAAGNVVGFGAGDFAREVARGGIIAAGGPAAEKSGIRQMGEKAYDAGKLVIDKARYGSMDSKTLASAIQSDPALHKTINKNGTTVHLAEALKDKNFRTEYLKTLEDQHTSGKFDRSTQMAMIRAYGDKVDATSQAPQANLAQAKPLTSPQLAASATPTATPQQIAQYKSMSLNQLGAAIQKDDVLPDRVKISGKEMDLAEALKDKNFRQSMIGNMEAAQAKGTDMATQIAMIKSYGEKLDASTPAAAPVMAANKQKPAITAPVA